MELNYDCSRIRKYVGKIWYSDPTFSDAYDPERDDYENCPKTTNEMLKWLINNGYVRFNNFDEFVTKQFPDLKTFLSEWWYPREYLRVYGLDITITVTTCASTA